MKAIIFVLICCSVYAAQAADKAETEAIFKKAMEQCAQEIKLTADEMKILQSPRTDMPDEKAVSANLKSFSLCFYKQLGLINKDDTVHEEHMTKYLHMMFSDPTKLQEVKKNCLADLKEKMTTETTYKFEVCLRKMSH